MRIKILFHNFTVLFFLVSTFLKWKEGRKEGKGKERENLPFLLSAVAEPAQTFPGLLIWDLHCFQLSLPRGFAPNRWPVLHYLQEWE